jgi:AcrR family transcriptional regulator
MENRQTRRSVGEARRNREAWLARALDVLRVEGIAGVKAARLARDLGVTTGSFYWHFKDLGDLRRAMLDYWESEMTLSVVRGIGDTDEDPREKLLHVLRLVEEHGLAEYDLAIRAWAMTDPEAKAIAERVDEQRYEFIRGLFRQLGFRGDDLAMRTAVFVAYRSSTSIFALPQSAKTRQRTLKLCHRLLTEI